MVSTHQNRRNGRLYPYTNAHLACVDSEPEPTPVGAKMRPQKVNFSKMSWTTWEGLINHKKMSEGVTSCRHAELVHLCLRGSRFTRIIFDYNLLSTLNQEAREILNDES